MAADGNITPIEIYSTNTDQPSQALQSPPVPQNFSSPSAANYIMTQPTRTLEFSSIFCWKAEQIVLMDAHIRSNTLTVSNYKTVDHSDLYRDLGFNIYDGLRNDAGLLISDIVMPKILSKLRERLGVMQIANYSRATQTTNAAPAVGLASASQSLLSSPALSVMSRYLVRGASDQDVVAGAAVANVSPEASDVQNPRVTFLPAQASIQAPPSIMITSPTPRVSEARPAPGALAQPGTLPVQPSISRVGPVNPTGAQNDGPVGWTSTFQKRRGNGEGLLVDVSPDQTLNATRDATGAEQKEKAGRKSGLPLSRHDEVEPNWHSMAASHTDLQSRIADMSTPQQQSTRQTAPTNASQSPPTIYHPRPSRRPVASYVPCSAQTRSINSTPRMRTVPLKGTLGHEPQEDEVPMHALSTSAMTPVVVDTLSRGIQERAARLRARKESNKEKKKGKSLSIAPYGYGENTQDCLVSFEGMSRDQDQHPQQQQQQQQQSQVQVPGAFVMTPKLSEPQHQDQSPYAHGCNGNVHRMPVNDQTNQDLVESLGDFDFAHRTLHHGVAARRDPATFLSHQLSPLPPISPRNTQGQTTTSTAPDATSVSTRDHTQSQHVSTDASATAPSQEQLISTLTAPSRPPRRQALAAQPPQQHPDPPSGVADGGEWATSRDRFIREMAVCHAAVVTARDEYRVAHDRLLGDVLDALENQRRRVGVWVEALLADGRLWGFDG